jgi:hypothetical protein
MIGVAGHTQDVALGDLGEQALRAPAHHVGDLPGLRRWIAVVEVQIGPGPAALAAALLLDLAHDLATLRALPLLALATTRAAVTIPVALGLRAMGC